MTDLDRAVLQVLRDLRVILGHSLEQLLCLTVDRRIGQAARPCGLLAIIGSFMHILPTPEKAMFRQDDALPDRVSVDERLMGGSPYLLVRTFPKGMRAMPSYRCYFLDGHDHIRAATDLEAEALAAAIDKALAILKLHPEHHAVEIWQGPRRLYPAAGEHPPLSG